MRRLFLVLSFSLLTGCNTFNGAIDGFERDVDRLAANVDRWSDGFLPAEGVGPQRYEPTHVDFPDDPRPTVGQRVRFGNPGR
ncbi:MAG: hypothetical protein AAGH92_10270 [Planctomycetota bacterium]